MTYKVRLENYHETRKGEPIKKKRGWVPCNDMFYLMAALWDYNHREESRNILKVSVPKVNPGYDLEAFLNTMVERNPSFICPEIIWRDEKSA